MTKRETRKLVRRSISDGKSKQDTFDDLSHLKNIPLEDLAQIIRKISSFEARSNYRILNSVLIILLSITIAFKLIAGIPAVMTKGLLAVPLLLISPILNILLLIGVASYNYLSYLWVAIFSIIGLLGIVINFSSNPSELLYLIDLATTGVFIFISFFLKSKLFPNYWTRKEIYQNEKGEDRMRYVFQFED